MTFAINNIWVSIDCFWFPQLPVSYAIYLSVHPIVYSRHYRLLTPSQLPPKPSYVMKWVRCLITQPCHMEYD